MTQEQLAEYLGITANAISQWECDRTAPDISQLPLLANVFEVTTDYLLEVNIFQKKEAIDVIRKEAWAFCNNGNKDEAIRILREGLKKYPNNYEMISDLIIFLYQRVFQQECTSEERISVCKEAANHIDHIISYCNDMKIKSTAIELACGIFPVIGRYEDASRLADLIPDTTRDEIYTALYRGKEKTDHVKNVICKSVSTAADQTIWLASSKNEEGNPIFTEDEQIALYQKAIEFYKTLYENGDFNFDSESFAEAEKHIANIWAQRKNSEKTLQHLTECVKYVILFDTYAETESSYTSLIPYGKNPVGINWNCEYNKSHEMLMRLENDNDYDFLRDDSVYKNLIKQLKTAEKSFVK